MEVGEGEGRERVVLHKIASGIRMAKFVGAMCTVSLIGKADFRQAVARAASLSSLSLSAGVALVSSSYRCRPGQEG